MPLQIGKVPIVVPRQFQFEEHVNDHQVEFCRAVAERQGSIVVVEHISGLKNMILYYGSVIAGMSAEQKSNNVVFNKEIGVIAENLIEKKPRKRK